MTKVTKTRIPLPGENPKKAPKIDETKRKAPPQLSEETIVHSDDASDSESNSGASEGSESDAEKLKSSKKPDVKKVKNTEIASPEVESDEGSEENEEESGSEESSEESDEDEEMTEAPSTNGASQPNAHTATNKPPPPFHPPFGFKAANSKTNPSSNLSKLLKPSDLAGKQIWHITAPASVPVASIKEIALDKARKGEAILQHGGVDYGFVEENKNEGKPTAILLPGQNGYEAVKSNITETFHVQQIVRLPNLSIKQADQSRGSDAAAHPFIPPTKPVRQQPKGLRMRYHPTGFEDEPGVIGSSESEGEDAIPRSKAPESAARAEKRKRDENEAEEAAAKKARKEKKKSDKASNKAKGNTALSSQLSQGAVPHGVEASQASTGAETEKKSKRADKDKKEKKDKKKKTHTDGGDPMEE